MNKFIVLFLLLIPIAAYATPISPIIPSGTTLPATCRTGAQFIDTDADTDGSLYICVATDTWKEVDDDGGAGGDIAKVGTPAQYEWGIWTGDGTLKGLAVTGSKVVCTDVNGEPVACTNLTDLAFSSYLAITDIDDSPVDSETSAPISSNWAYDHVAAADPHAGYVLESDIGSTVQAYDADTAKTDEAETLTAAWDLAGSDADSVTGIPLDSDFGSNGIMVRTGAGTYGIGTTFDIQMGGEDWILMGEAGGTFNAEQIAPAAALTALESYRAAWADYESTTTGFTNDPTPATKEFVHYRVKGDEVSIFFNIEGTSDATDFSFTLPHTIKNTDGFSVSRPVSYKDNGSWASTWGRVVCVYNTSTCNVYTDAGTGVFTASGAKASLGDFIYVKQ